MQCLRTVGVGVFCGVAALACGDSHERDVFAHAWPSQPEAATRVTFRTDDNCDGVAEARHVTTSDALGRPLSVVSFGRGDATMALHRQTYRYDDAQRVTDYTFDVGADGPGPDDLRGMTFVDEQGRDIEMREQHFGTPPTCWRTSYDASSRRSEYDEGCDDRDVRVSCETEETHMDGSLVVALTENDSDCDGTPEWCAEMVRDTHEQIVRFVADEACDGTTDSNLCSNFVYDDEGRVTYEDRGACDDTPDRCVERTWNEMGILTTEIEDVACDGTEDRCTFTEIDEEGAATSFAGCSDTRSDCITRTYDADGNETSLSSDPMCNGDPHSCSTTEYERL